MSDYIAGALDAICCVHGLFTDVSLPAFDWYRLDGMLQQQTGGGQRERATAALDWMQRHYDSLYAAAQAGACLAEMARDRVEGLAYA